MVTETDEVGAALARMRRADPGRAVNLAELVVLGVDRKLELIERERIHDQRRAELRERFLRRTTTGERLDWETLLEAHDRGWAHPLDG